ncbi:MAG TPA: hypothetical protein VF019_05070, partial [Nitrospira sp.]
PRPGKDYEGRRDFYHPRNPSFTLSPGLLSGTIPCAWHVRAGTVSPPLPSPLIAPHTAIDPAHDLVKITGRPRLVYFNHCHC